MKNKNEFVVWDDKLDRIIELLEEIKRSLPPVLPQMPNYPSQLGNPCPKCGRYGSHLCIGNSYY